MGAIFPDKLVEQIDFCEGHDPLWAVNFAAIGVSSAEVTALTGKTTAARAAFVTQRDAQIAAKNSTLAYQTAVAAMSAACRDLIKKIKGKAATDGDGVYVLAGIPAPATPTPVGPPGTPTDFTALLRPDGSLQLQWKCPNPVGASGTIYQVARKSGSGAGATFAIIGGAGNRKFIDDTVPAGVASLTYRIVAQRSTATGAAGEFLVNFGIGGAGEATASIVQAGGAPKLAA